MFLLFHAIIDDEVLDEKLPDTSGMPRLGINKPRPLWKF